MSDYKEHTFTDRLGVAIGLIAFIMLISSGYAADAGGCWDGTSGGIIHWSFDDADILGGETWDKCGGETNGTNQTVFSGFAGVFNEAYDFNGDGTVGAGQDTIWNSVSTESDLAATVGVSWTFWVNPDANPGVNYFIGMPAYDGTAVGYYGSYDNGGANIFGCTIRDTNPQLVAADPAIAAGIGDWTKIGCAWNATNTTMAVYVNGTWVSSANNAAVNANMFTANTRYSAGAGWQQSTVSWRYGLHGQMDEMWFFNETLNATQMMNLYTDNNVDGAAACTVDYSPIIAEVDVATAFTGTKGVTCGAFDGNYYWNFTNSTGFSQQPAGTNPTSETFTNTGQWIGEFTATIVGVNYTQTQNITVADLPIANWTITTAAPYFALDTIQFNDTSTDSGGFTPFTNWYWDFGDGNTSVVQNATNIFVEPGGHEVCLIVTNSLGFNSTEYCANATINGIMINVYNEKTWAEINNWTMTVSNSTYTRTFTDQNNSFLWDNFTDFPTGLIQISINADGYVGRNYYRTYSIGTYVNLNAYLLGTADGLFSYFIVQDPLGTVLSDVILTFQFLNGSAWITAGEAQTDDTGSASMWLDWTKSYTVTASKDGYTPVTKSFTPQAITYYIVMGTASIFEFIGLNASMWTSLLPTNPEVNATTDSITMAVFDPANGISICGLNLTFTNGTVFSSTNITTEATLCTGTIVLATSGLGTETRFYAIPWFTANATGDYFWTRLYNVDGSDGSSVTNAIESLRASWGSEALLMIAIFITLICGAAAAFFLGSGSTIVMMAVSGIFFYYGFFGAFAPLWFIAVVAGLAALYIERRQY